MVKNEYKTNYEQKQERIYVRMDASMIEKLNQIKAHTGISISEIIRQGVRDTFSKYFTKGDNSEVAPSKAE